jgi:hypothetical protein
MSVVNCKVKYIRPKYKNLKEWTEDNNNVYIGRAGVVFIDSIRFPKTASPFANPFKVGKDGSRSQVLEKYKKYIKSKLRTNVELRKKLMKMKGKNLGCWCKPEPCHGDVLVKILNTFS